MTTFYSHLRSLGSGKFSLSSSDGVLTILTEDPSSDDVLTNPQDATATKPFCKVPYLTLKDNLNFIWIVPRRAHAFALSRAKACYCPSLSLDRTLTPSVPRPSAGSLRATLASPHPLACPEPMYSRSHCRTHEQRSNFCDEATSKSFFFCGGGSIKPSSATCPRIKETFVALHPLPNGARESRRCWGGFSERANSLPQPYLKGLV